MSQRLVFEISRYFLEYLDTVIPLYRNKNILKLIHFDLETLLIIPNLEFGRFFYRKVGKFPVEIEKTDWILNFKIFWILNFYYNKILVFMNKINDFQINNLKNIWWENWQFLREIDQI